MIIIIACRCWMIAGMKVAAVLQNSFITIRHWTCGRCTWHRSCPQQVGLEVVQYPGISLGWITGQWTPVLQMDPEGVQEEMSLSKVGLRKTVGPGQGLQAVSGSVHVRVRHTQPSSQLRPGASRGCLCKGRQFQELPVQTEQNVLHPLADGILSTGSLL